MRARELEIQAEIRTDQDKTGSTADDSPVVDEEDIAYIVASWTGYR